MTESFVFRGLGDMDYILDYRWVGWNEGLSRGEGYLLFLDHYKNFVRRDYSHGMAWGVFFFTLKAIDYV